jgi:hypothetical protein
MKAKPFRLIFTATAVVLLIAYVLRLGEEYPVESLDTDTARHGTIAIFGATGTAGDGVLKAAMSDSDVAKIHVVTRRASPRIDAGVATGLVQMTTHLDYLDYTPLQELLSEVDTVYWALGTASANVTEEQYGVIHVDYPVSMAKEWMNTKKTGELSFHLISGMSASADSRMMWAREKARAESALFELADGTNMRVISYRPAYIVPTEEQANFGHNVLHAIFAPIKLALRATVIGEAMLEVSARGGQLENRTILENREVMKFSNGYRQRLGLNDEQ